MNTSSTSSPSQLPFQLFNSTVGTEIFLSLSFAILLGCGILLSNVIVDFLKQLDEKN